MYDMEGSSPAQLRTVT